MQGKQASKQASKSTARYCSRIGIYISSPPSVEYVIVRSDSSLRVESQVVVTLSNSRSIHSDNNDSSSPSTTTTSQHFSTSASPSSSNTCTLSTPTRASSVRTVQLSTAREASKHTPVETMPADKKSVAGDVQMKDAQDASKKDASGDVEMGGVSNPDKKDDENAEEKEDPAVTTANGNLHHLRAPRQLHHCCRRILTCCRDQTELHTVRAGRQPVRCSIHPARPPVDSVGASQGHARDHCQCRP